MVYGENICVFTFWTEWNGKEDQIRKKRKKEKHSLNVIHMHGGDRCEMLFI